MKSILRHTKPKPAGSVNPCARAAITDAAGKLLAWCNDTPNAIAMAFNRLPAACLAEAYYPHFKPCQTTRDDVAHRIPSAGYGITDKEASFTLV